MSYDDFNDLRIRIDRVNSELNSAMTDFMHAYENREEEPGTYNAAFRDLMRTIERNKGAFARLSLFVMDLR